MKERRKKKQDKNIMSVSATQLNKTGQTGQRSDNTRRTVLQTVAQKTQMLIRNDPVMKSVESVLTPEGESMVGVVKAVGLESGVKERGSYEW